jgi:hypothetical protein
LLSRTSSTPDGKQLSGLESHVAFIIDGQVYGVGDYADRQAVEKKRNELVAQPPTEKNALGEQRLYGQDVLLTLAPGDRSVEMIARHGFTNLPEFLILPSMDWMVTVRHLLGMATR